MKSIKAEAEAGSAFTDASAVKGPERFNDGE
jgi:hypothetical protein